MKTLKGKDFLKLLDFSSEEIIFLICLSEKLKAIKKNGISHALCSGKNAALIFEKTSTRTRCSFEVAARDLGMGTTYLDPSASQIGKKESIADTARVLSGMFEGIEYRGFGQSRVEELAKYASVPVWNGLYATPETSAEISTLGIDVETVRASSESDRIFRLMENGKINYIVYTGALLDSTVDEYIALHRRALRKGVPCFTSLDTANAFADIIAGRFTQMNTELVDINNMRKEHRTLRFEKLQATGDDYIFAENFNGEITCPESLSVSLCARHTGIGAYGLVLMEKSDIADVKMRLFNSDGTFGGTGGNAVRCVGKYLYDNKLTDKNTVTVETPSGVVKLKLFISSGEVSYVCADMGKADFTPSAVPVLSNGKSVIEMPYEVGGKTYIITCLSMGNPHCVVLTDRVDKAPVDEIGPLFENAPIFPERTNTEFVRVVNKNMIKMRVWERGNGETYACGTGACAAVAAAVKSGLCSEGEPVTVKVRGGDLTVTVTENGILLTGNAERVFKGEVRY